MRPADLRTRLDDHRADRSLVRQVDRVKAFLAGRAIPRPASPPIVFFNASTRIHRLSLNAAFGLLAGWGVRLAGVPVVQAVCRTATPQCPLGTDRTDLDRDPPCRRCTSFSRRAFREPGLEWLEPEAMSSESRRALEAASFADLLAWEAEGLQIGELVLPSLRWVLRRHDLEPRDDVVRLARRYVAGAAALARRFGALVERIRPAGLVVFNGIMFPEAVAREVFRRAGIRVVTHEVGLRPFSAFFSHEHATFRRIEPEVDPISTDAERTRLDRYLSERFDGRFTMAGIRFWPDILPIPDELRRRLEAGPPAVVVFTNVVFDTSQVHANTIYPSMFAWLEDVRSAIERHPDQTFIVRAHPDEDRPGKQSRQSVRDWVRHAGVDRLPNVVFVPPEAGLSSYDLFRFARLALVYNSSIGLEASIAGLPVLCAGRARYSEAGAAVLPVSAEEYRRLLDRALEGGEFGMPADHRENARRFLDFELFRASLDFSPFLQDRPGHPGMVEFRDFDPADLLHSDDLTVVVEGIRKGTPFVLPRLVPASESGGPRSPSATTEKGILA